MSDIELQVGVKVLLRNPKGQFLLIHRSAGMYPEVPNPWEIPGGRIDPGSPLLDNLKREVTEEVQLPVIGTPHIIDAQDILRIEGRHVVRLTYLADTNGDPSLGDEHDDFKWIGLDEILATEGLDIYVKGTVEKLLHKEITR